jgi:hypothetical protein
MTSQTPNEPPMLHKGHEEREGMEPHVNDTHNDGVSVIRKKERGKRPDLMMMDPKRVAVYYYYLL